MGKERPEGLKNKGHVDHVEEERLADLAREKERDRKQMEMFDDTYENWSGHRLNLWDCSVTRT